MPPQEKYRQILCATYLACTRDIKEALYTTAKIYGLSEDNIAKLLAMKEIKKYEKMCWQSPKLIETMDPSLVCALCSVSKRLKMLREKGRGDVAPYVPSGTQKITFPRAPFKWAGGKRRILASYIDIFFPPKQPKVFVDMFCGAGSVGLWMAEQYPGIKIILNDANKELIDMYKVIRDSYPKFEKEYMKIVGKCPRTPEERKKYYYTLREEYCHHYNKLSKEKIAADLFFMLKTNFNGIWRAYKKCRLRYSTSPGAMTFAPKFLKVEPIRKFSQFLQRCELKCGDFGKLDKWMNPGTYYYADPPYRSTDVVYQGGFEDKEQKRLASFLTKASDKGCWIAESNREIGDKFWDNVFPKKFHKHYIRAVKYTVGAGKKTQKKDEVLITNF